MQNKKIVFLKSYWIKKFSLVMHDCIFVTRKFVN